MIIRDKQDLRKCVKQSVRRAGIVEIGAWQGVLNGAYGITQWLGESYDPSASLNEQFGRCCEGSPFAGRPAELLAALDALNLPVHDLDKAQAILEGYDSAAYRSMALDALRARRVLVEADPGAVVDFYAGDGRIAPLLLIDNTFFVPGRYGVGYEHCAQQIVQMLEHVSASDVKLAVFNAEALMYCLIPVCEDTKAVLHLHVTDIHQWQSAKSLLALHPEVRALVSAEVEIEKDVIRDAAKLSGMLVCVEATENIPYALMHLGTRFTVHPSRAASLEELLGRWIRTKEALWLAMCDAYLPLARTGYELTREQIEADAELLLGGNLMKFYEQ